MSETKDHNEIALVIFPFENLTEGSGLEIFCRSFHIDLITELSRFRHFTVISHSEGGGASSLCADYTIKGSIHGAMNRGR